jgi:hypothetical protein
VSRRAAACGAAALAVVVVTVVAAAGCGGGGPAHAGDGSGPLRWAAAPELFTPATLPGDRILTGTLRNQSVRRVRVNLTDVRVLARNGDPIAGAQPVFLQTFGKSLWSPARGPDVMPDSELLRTGRLAFLRPGEEVPITVAWHARSGRPAAVDYGAGLVPVPR